MSILWSKFVLMPSQSPDIEIYDVFNQWVDASHSNIISDLQTTGNKIVQSIWLISHQSPPLKLIRKPSVVFPESQVPYNLKKKKYC